MTASAAPTLVVPADDLPEDAFEAAALESRTAVVRLPRAAHGTGLDLTALLVDLDGITTVRPDLRVTATVRDRAASAGRRPAVSRREN